MQNLSSSSRSFKVGNSRLHQDLSGYVTLGLVIKKVRRLQRRLARIQFLQLAGRAELRQRLDSPK